MKIYNRCGASCKIFRKEIFRRPLLAPQFFFDVHSLHIKIFSEPSPTFFLVERIYHVYKLSSGVRQVTC